MAFHDLIFAFSLQLLILLIPILFFLIFKPLHTCIFLFFSGAYLSTSSLFFTEVSPTNTSGLYTTILQKDFLWHLGQVLLLYAQMGMLRLTYYYTLVQLLCLVPIHLLLNHKLHEGMKNVSVKWMIYYCFMHLYLDSSDAFCLQCLLFPPQFCLFLFRF